VTIDEAQAAEATGVYLLFAAGKRPSCADLRRFTEKNRAVSISHAPLDDAMARLVPADATDASAELPISCDHSNSVWIELLRDGLTFDVCGLAPGSSCTFPEIEHRFDLDQQPNTLRMQAVRLLPGQHLRGGESSMPVAKGMVALACDLTHHFEDLQAVVWGPSASAIGRRYFESIATAWIEGGAFPALGLTAFRETVDGALQSVGLDHWIGQEVRIESPLSDDKVAATRLGVRLVNQLILIGGLDESERVIAPDGTRLVMRPSRNGKFVRVWRE
jgi:hypothetical protein